MKASFLLLSALLLSNIILGQSKILAVGKDKTVSLVFPYAIRHVDRGANDILVQKVQDADNVLLIKAGAEDFRETSLSVLTDDGNMYSFVVRYNARPDTLVYHLPVNKQQAIATYATAILDNPRTVFKIQDNSNNVRCRVMGIYIKENIAFYQIEVTNTSNINYDLELIRFFIRDKKKIRRTAVQEIELKPLHISGNNSRVKAKGSNMIAVALEKFTIPDAKYMAVQLLEKNGGRNLLMKVDNRHIMKSTVLPDLR